MSSLVSVLYKQSLPAADCCMFLGVGREISVQVHRWRLKEKYLTKKKKKILLSRKRETGLLSTESNSYSSYVSVI